MKSIFICVFPLLRWISSVCIRGDGIIRGPVWSVCILNRVRGDREEGADVGFDEWLEELHDDGQYNRSVVVKTGSHWFPGKRNNDGCYEQAGDRGLTQ